MVERWFNSFSGNLILTGCAECVFDDYRKAVDIFGKADIMCVNMSGVCFKGVKHLVSLHSENIEGFLKAAMIRTKTHIHTYSVKSSPYTERIFPSTGSGSSGLYAAVIAVKLGYSRIILCGMPLSGDRKFYDTDDIEKPLGDRANILGWQSYKPLLSPFVRSMSGRTRDLLGFPWKKTEVIYG